MYSIETGTVFIGFTGPIKCNRCGNYKHMLLRRSYSLDRFFLIPLGMNFGPVLRVCPVCEDEKTIVIVKKNIETSELHSYLEEGKLHTKLWFNSLSEKEKSKVVKRYEGLLAFDFVRYLFNK